MTPAARDNRMKRFFTALLMLLCLAALPMNAAAETENDVYAALRGIGVPETYISQAAGLLTSGNSDGAGVYRNGKYYPYSELVGYIHDNSEMILEFCGIFADDSDAAMRAAERIAEQKGITIPASGTGKQSAAAQTSPAAPNAPAENGTTLPLLTAAATTTVTSTATETATSAETSSATSETSAETTAAETTVSGSLSAVTELTEASAVTLAAEISAAEISALPAETGMPAAAASAGAPHILMWCLVMLLSVGGIIGIVFMIKHNAE